MVIVLTNDDGIHAPGLAALAEALADLGTLRIVAPEAPQSGVGHRVTTGTPIRVRRDDEGRCGVDGTPADCVRLALKQLVPDADWVIAGINPGANLGSDVYQSGTTAAAREAAILGCRSIAVSQYIAKDVRIDWPVTAACACEVVSRLLSGPLDPGCFWNVNLPSPLAGKPFPAMAFCGLDPHPHRYDFRKENDAYVYEGTIHERPRQPGKDVDVCFGGRISVTRIALDTAVPSLEPRSP